MVHPASIVVVHPVSKPGADVCLYKNGGCAQVCESKLGLAYCSCLPQYILSPDGKNCYPLETPNITTDIDECEVGTHNCDSNADCLNTAGSFLCRCQTRFHGDGHTCQEVETIPPIVSNVTPGHHNSQSVESCPSSHDSYCLYQGVCFYFPEMKSYACNCASGYMGERCQFSDLEWWELQQVEGQKMRNITIAACMVGLISLLSIAACVTYCYGTRKLFRKKTSEDNMSETSMTVEHISETTTCSVPQFSMTTERAVHPVMGCPRRAVCPSCSSEPGDNLEGSETLAKHNRGYECSMVSAVAMATDQLPIYQSSFTTFKPQEQTASPETSGS